MRTPIRALAASLLALSAVACTTTSVNSIWTAQPKLSEPYRKLLIVGVANNRRVRLAYEDNFVEALATHGIEGIASHHATPNPDSIEPQQIQLKAQNAGADAVVVTHLIAEDGSGGIPTHRVERVPLTYLRLGDYVRQSETTIEEEGYYSGAVQLQLEANLYDSKEASLVWSGRTRALEPNSEQTTIRQIILDLIEQLEADGYLPAPETEKSPGVS